MAGWAFSAGDRNRGPRHTPSNVVCALGRRSVRAKSASGVNRPHTLVVHVLKAAFLPPMGFFRGLIRCGCPPGKCAYPLPWWVGRRLCSARRWLFFGLHRAVAVAPRGCLALGHRAVEARFRRWRSDAGPCCETGQWFGCSPPALLGLNQASLAVCWPRQTACVWLC